MASEPRVRPHNVDSVEDSFAAGLRGFGSSGIIAIVLILLAGNMVLSNMLLVPLGAILVLVWVYLSHTPWKEIGYVWPRQWFITLVGGTIAGFALKILLKSIVMPLLGAAPENQTYHFLMGNRELLPMATLSMLIAGFAEETVFRGFLFERLGKLIGSGTWAKVFTIQGTSMIFSLGHYSDQGMFGSIQAMFTGLTFGIIYAFSGRLVFAMAAHAGYDLLSLAMIYSGTETEFAQFFIR